MWLRLQLAFVDSAASALRWVRVLGRQCIYAWSDKTRYSKKSALYDLLAKLAQSQVAQLLNNRWLIATTLQVKAAKVQRQWQPWKKSL